MQTKKIFLGLGILAFIGGILSVFAQEISNITLVPNLDIARFDSYQLNITTSGDILSGGYQITAINGDGESCIDYYTSGSCASSGGTTTFTGDLIASGSNTWIRNNIRPDYIYPQVFFAPDEITWNNTPSNAELNRNSYELMYFTNPFTMETDMSFFLELNIEPRNSANSVNLLVYLIEKNKDISFFGSDRRNNTGVEFIGSFSRTALANHTHTTNSSHYLIPLSTNGDGTLGTKNIDISSNFWIALVADTSLPSKGRYLRYQTDALCQNTSGRYEGNLTDRSTTRQSGCPDAHIHVARRGLHADGLTTNIIMYASGGSTITGEWTGSFAPLPNLAPNNTSFITPTTGTYTGDIGISRYPAIDPNGDSITYNIYLTDTGGNIINTLTGGISATTFTRDSTSTGDGIYNLKGEACDGSLCTAFNLEDDFSVDNVADPDTTPPTATVEYTPASGSRTSSDVIATVTGFSETVTGLNATGYTFTGNGVFIFTFEDLAGNTGEAVATVDRIDKEVPTFLGVTSGTTYTTGVTITFSDNTTGVSATLSGNAYTNGTPITGNGIYIFIVTDLAGNSTGATFTINIDTTPPTATIEYTPASGSRTSGDVIAIVTGFSETVTGLNATGYTFTGNGVFTFTFEDLAGNTGEAVATVNRIDKTQPTATIDYTPGTRTSGNVIAVLTGFSETLTGINTGTYIFSGNGIFLFTFEDLAGNTGETTANVNWIDDTVPLFASTGTITPSTGSAEISNIIITETGAGLATATMEYSGVNNSTITGTIQLSTGNTNNLTGNIAGLEHNATYFYLITITDNVGNINFVTGTFDTIIDRNIIYTEVRSGNVLSGINNNLATVTNDNVTNFTGLYLEIPSIGKIELQTGIDLTNTGTQSFLQSLGENMIMENGFINFILYNSSTESGSAFKNLPATLTMYLTTAQYPNGAGSENNIVVRDTDGTIIDSSSILSNFVCSASALTGIAQECSFDTLHFTSFGTKPILNLVNIASSNTNTGYAKVGDTITLSFTGSENLTGVSATIAGNAASISGTGTDRTATYTLTGGETEGVTSITIDFEDFYLNTGITVTSTTDASQVIFDETNPTITNITTGEYFSGDVTPTITETNYSGATLNGSPYTSGTTITGEGVWEIIVYDLAGNSGATTFTIDKTQPSFAGITSGSYYSGSQTITFTGTDISGATLNGSPYTSGTVISSEGTYVFIVYDLAGNSTGATFIIDTTNPTTTAAPNGSTGRVDVSIILTPIDTGATIEQTYYCIDTANTCIPNITGTSAIVTGASASITTKYLRFYSIDKSYNTETIHSARFYIDKETPVLTGATTFSSNNATNTGYTKIGDTITVLFQSHEALTGTPTMTISGGSLTTGTVTNIGGNNYSGSYVMKSSDTEGTIGFNIFMTDLVGNTGTIFTGSTIIFDKTAPAGISITAPTTTTYLKGDPDVYTILWNVGTDNNWSPTSILLEYSLTNFVSTTNITTGTINDGSHTFMFPNTLNTFARIRIIATDLAGNVGYFTGNQFSIDNTPPTDITITYPGLYLKGNSGYQINRSGGIDANPQTIVLSYTTNGTTFNTICTRTNNEQNCSRTTPSLNSSTVQLRTIATDEVGMNKQRTTPTFIVDSTPPTAIVFADNNNNRRNTDAIATGTSTDTLAGLRSTGMVYRTDTPFTGTCNGGTTTPPTFTGEGYRTGYACISDNAGNIRTGQQSYKIDKTLPTLQTGSDITVNTATTINITGTDALAGISGYIRSQTSGPGTISFTTNTSEDPTVSADTDGEYVLQILLIDNANNSTTGTIHFTRDTVNPILNGAASVLNTTSQTPNYSFTGDEAGTISYSGACSSTTTAAISGLNTITFTALANATYSTCQLRVTDTAGNSSSRLTIPTFTVNYSAPSGGGGGGGGGSVGICTANQLMCVSGIYAMKAGVNCQGGDLGKPCGTDICVDGDYSGDPNDGICYDPTKVEAGTGTTTGTTITGTGSRIPFISPYNEELTDAYSYAYGVKITTVPDIKRANLTGVLIRSHLAKMMSQYATKVLGKKPDTTRNCVFKDMNGQTEEFKMFAVMACQLGLMGLKTDGSPADVFNPDDEVNRAIFGTTLSRALFGDAYNGGQNRYKEHLDALKEKAVMNYIEKPFNLELRGYVMLMMMRADQKLMKSSYSNFTSLRGSKNFVPGKTITVTPGNSQFTETELDFIENLNKAYQFNAGYTVGESDIGVKYLQYLLKSKGYYAGTINGINTNDTVTALYEFQFDNNIVDKATDQGAGYLGPSTRELLNPLLQTLLNP